MKSSKVHFDDTIDQSQFDKVKASASEFPEAVKFAFAHSPFLNNTNPLMVELQELMVTEQFDAYFCGHVHLYARREVQRLETGLDWTFLEVTAGGAGVDLEGQSRVDKYNKDKTCKYAESSFDFVLVEVFSDRTVATAYMPNQKSVIDHEYVDSDWVCKDKFVMKHDGKPVGVPCP